MAIRPIFLFSIARSGSTLVQRVIAAHEGVSTVSEPWLVLPHAYSLRREGVDSEYTHPVMVEAIEDFCGALPGGVDEYRRELHDSVLRLYEKAAGEGARYFLDKSPYQYAVDEVMRLFPDGKFVFLWRNPMSVIASITKTWEHAKWKPTVYRSELFLGLPRLIAAYRANSERSCSVRFEDLVVGDTAHWTRLMSYLDIEFDARALERFAQVELNGRMGDPTGVKQYQALSTEPMQKWKEAFANPLRKEWCRRYLRWLGAERLALMGYDLDGLLAELDAQPLSMDHLLGDVGRTLVDVAKEPVRVRTRNRKLGSPNVIRLLLGA
jgi:hypothetical protein